jgi:hypothetical protein
MRKPPGICRSVHPRKTALIASPAAGLSMPNSSTNSGTMLAGAKR